MKVQWPQSPHLGRLNAQAGRLKPDMENSPQAHMRVAQLLHTFSGGIFDPRNNLLEECPYVIISWPDITHVTSI